MRKKNHFDFVEFAYNKLIKNFQHYILVGRTIPMKSIYRMCGLLFSLNKQQTRALIEDIAKRYRNVKRNCQGVKILKLTTETLI